jgi:hypothetical protein
VLQKFSVFVLCGIAWLFLFSIPMSQTKNLFEVLHFYVVDTRPVQWVLGKAQTTYHTTIEATESVAQPAARSGREALGQSAEILKGIE